MTLNYPGGVPQPVQSGTVPTRKNKGEKKPRRITEAGGNSQYAVSSPPKDSPLRPFLTLCRAQGWKADYLKFPCDCEIWDNRCANAVVLYREQEHRIVCTCEVETVEV